MPAIDQTLALLDCGRLDARQRESVEPRAGEGAAAGDRGLGALEVEGGAQATDLDEMQRHTRAGRGGERTAALVHLGDQRHAVDDLAESDRRRGHL